MNQLRGKLLIAWTTAALLSVLGYALWRANLVGFAPQELFNRVTQALGVPRVFQFIHSILGIGQDAKILAFLSVSLLWLGGSTLLGLLRPWLGAVILGALLLTFAPPLDALVYGVSFFLLRVLLDRVFAPRAQSAAPLPVEPSRRTTLALLGGGSALLVGGGLLNFFRQVNGVAQAARVVPGQPLPFGVTPVSQFYYVSKNLEAFDPKLKEENWRLKVGGLVSEERTFTLADLQEMPAKTLELTLSCISNPLGGPLISNGIWRGVPVSDFLRRVGVQKGAKYVIWEAADGYIESLPLGQAFEEDVLLVYELNGEPLTQKHGFPLRVLIPGRYGMKQPRWITAIRLSDTDEAGYWVQRGWSKTAVVELTSRIDVPAELNPIVKADESTTLHGIAFAGKKEITKVEVSVDGGRTWRAARLEPKRSQHAWTLWSLDWTPKRGSYQLAVRAWSGDEVQKSAEADALPEGATGYHRFIVTAS
ncbi:molybdopterin-dependent oxidoreductase [Deinococcus yavapaiensis]|uniref:DMSO/TMAO reductase YedYZ molybdopterin-dependent catalytic subunit n=1 Tax=Deinococcus yavapaiensis KR-236 TaxID=694435 RepID=A0A318SQ02_9DEIO|nr:molybdopterin-dependent oxidoreductase [Deinococcus yavapaiensis]PYE54913.1 DMSO/TMAO reductase YedYZ molybdopterin-dependent catalytic subunit [Deinococcus yavapaiensis KR-236]